MAAAMPGGAVPRAVSSGAVDSGQGIVYDRDIVSTWRIPSSRIAQQIFLWEKAFEHALAQETMFVAIEAFTEDLCSAGGMCSRWRTLQSFDHELTPFRDEDTIEIVSLLQTFRTYLEDLGKQSLTITISSLVRDMVESFRNSYGESDILNWSCGGLFDALEEFVLTRECWIYRAGTAPALEVKFNLPRQPAIATGVDIELHYSWHPPVVNFKHLQNTIWESSELILRPCISSIRPFCDMSNVDIEYYIGPSCDWLA
jgi:hypothetical protein